MKTTSHKLVSKCISDSHVYCRFNGYLVCCCLSQSHKSKFAFEKKNANGKENVKPFSLRKSFILPLVLFLIIPFLKYISHDYWLFWHLQVEYWIPSARGTAHRIYVCERSHLNAFFFNSMCQWLIQCPFDSDQRWVN